MSRLSAYLYSFAKGRDYKMIWTENYRVSAQDVDFDRVASASAMMRFMQDTANCHMEGAGPSYDELFDSGRAFIIARFAADFLAPLHSHDEIDVETWAAPSRAASFNRCYRVLRGGEVIACASSVWALVDTKSGALLRVEECGIDYGVDDALEVVSPIRFRIPADAPLREVGRHIVTYADVDVNRHMNNTKYADLLCSYLPDEGGRPALEGRRVGSLSIAYSAEAPLGGEIAIYHAECDGAHWFRTMREDGKTNVEARIVLVEI